MTEKIEERAIPEPIVVKREMLYACYNASHFLSEYLKDKRRKSDYKQFKKWVSDLFFKLEIKIDFKEKNYKVLNKMQDFVNNGTKLKYKDWVNCFWALRKKLEELGITKIEMAEEDIYTVLKRP